MITKEDLIYEVVIKFTSNGELEPIRLTEEYFKSKGILKSNDQSIVKVGTISTKIIFQNESCDELTATKNKLLIKSIDTRRIHKILSSIEDLFSSLHPSTASLTHEYHLNKVGYPETLLQEKFGKGFLSQIDAIRLKKDDFIFTLFICGKDRIHIKSEQRYFDLYSKKSRRWITKEYEIMTNELKTVFIEDLKEITPWQ